MSDEKELLGARIKELRKGKGLTQQQLAEMIEIDPKHLSKIEVGNSYPSMYNLEKITKALNVKMQDLFKSEHHKSRKELVKSINEMLNSASDDAVQLTYKIISEILC